MSQIYMIGYILFIGMLLGIIVLIAVFKFDEREETRQLKECREYIEKQAHRIEVLQAEIIVLKDRLEGDQDDDLSL